METENGNGSEGEGMTKRRRTNLRQIAQHLGISASTVSRALRGLPGIHPETREQVHAAAEKLGYRGADSVSSRAFRNVLTLSQGLSSASDHEYLAGMSSAAVALNMSLISHHYRPEESGNILNPAFQPRALTAGQVDGIVLIHKWPEEIARALRTMYPVVSIVHSYPGADVDVISIDDRTGMDEMVQHLLSAGYKRLGFFGLCREMSWARSRFAGFVEAMVQHRQALRLEDVVEVSLEEARAETEFEHGESMAKASAATRGGVDAWICSSEMIASSLHEHLFSEGFRIPENVAVTGFHSSQSSARAQRILLTTTESPSSELGAAALRRLVHRIEGTDLSRRVILLPCTLRQGSSTRATS